MDSDKPEDLIKKIMETAKRHADAAMKYENKERGLNVAVSAVDNLLFATVHGKTYKNMQPEDHAAIEQLLAAKYYDGSIEKVRANKLLARESPVDGCMDLVDLNYKKGNPATSLDRPISTKFLN